MLRENENKMRQQITSMQDQLRGVSRINEQKQEAEAYASYPELNPKSGNFDEGLQEQVISYMATSFAKGKNPTLKESADKLMSIANRAAKKAKKEGAKEALEQLSPKEQASLEATGRSDRRKPSNNIENLRVQTRQSGTRGTMAAMERLKGIPTVGN